MRRTADQLPVIDEELVPEQVKRMAPVRTNVGVRENIGTLAHDESAERPIPIADIESPGARIGQVLESTDRPLRPVSRRFVVHCGSACRRVTKIASSIPGIPIAEA